MKKQLLVSLAILSIAALAVAHEEHAHPQTQHQEGQAQGDTTTAIHEATTQDSARTSEILTVNGEVLDMACYLSEGVQGPDHADCAMTCIESGLPVGIKDKDGKVYLLIGEHKPINKTLAPYGGKTITVRGKPVSRDGINLLENVEIIQ
jgi:hypothetical protein